MDKFATAVRGEWTGYEGNFDGNSAKVQPVPDYYIPDQFVEWGLVPHGFESNHSVTVRGDKLYRKFFRILPGVSLFADHVDLEEDLVILPLGADAAAPTTPDALPVPFADGSFMSGARVVPIELKSRLEKHPQLKLSLRDPRVGETSALNLWLRFDLSTHAFVGDVRAVIETHTCQYCDGADIEGSSGFVDGWVSGGPGCAADLKGEWAQLSCLVFDPSDEPEDLAEAVVLRGDESDAHVHLFLPGGIDIAIRPDNTAFNDAYVMIQSGWLVDEDTRVVLRRSFDKDGAVAYSQRVVERRVS